MSSDPHAALHTQRKQITLLCLSLAPASLPETRGPLHALASTLIEAHGGLVQGGAAQPDGTLLALFGLPTSGEEDPLRALRAALAIQQAVQQEPSLAGQPPLLGLSTGVMLVSASAGRGSYTAMGEALGEACSATEGMAPGSVILTQQSYRHVADHVVAELLPTGAAGQADVRRYRVSHLRPASVLLPNRRIVGVESPLVGRADEVAAMQGAAQQALATGAAQAILLLGEAGVGKSRLLREFDGWLTAQPQPLLKLVGRANPDSSATPYALLRDLFDRLFGILESDESAVARSKLMRGVALECGPASQEWAPFLGHLLGYDFSATPPVKRLLDNSEPLRERGSHALLRFFAEAHRPHEGEQRALLLLLEGLHWADEGSLALLAQVAANSSALPLLVVATARPSFWDQHPTWLDGAAHWLRVGALPLAQGQRLAQQLLRRVQPLPPSVPLMLAERAGGNPFFLEELIQTLIDDRVIEPGGEDDPWQLHEARLASLRLPTTLVGVLEARLGSLSSHERALLACAAVVGRAFWDSALVALLGEEREGQPPLAEMLQRLLARGLILEQPTSRFATAREFLFAQPMLHEVAYAQVLRQRRRFYHVQAASWLIEQSGARVGEVAALIAHHYEQAENWPTAGEWYAWAARRTEGAYVPAAISYYEKALAFLSAPDNSPQAARQLDLLEGLGKALYQEARFQEANSIFQAMERAAAELGEAPARMRALIHLAGVHVKQGQAEASLAALEQAEALAAHASGVDAELANAWRLKGWVVLRMGAVEEALALAEQAFSLSSLLNDGPLMAQCLNLLGIIQGRTGHFARATNSLLQALPLFRAAGDEHGVGLLLNNLGVQARRQEDFDAAAAYFDEALTLARQTGHRDLEVLYLSNLGGAHDKQGRATLAEAELREALATAQRLDNPQRIALAASYLADLLCRQQRAPEAMAPAALALSEAQRSRSLENIGMAWRSAGRCAAEAQAPFAQGEQRHAPEECFARSLAIFEQIQNDSERARTLEAWAAYEAARGDPVTSEQLAREALQLFQRLGLHLGSDPVRQPPVG